jgi:hypothetical protein
MINVTDLFKRTTIFFNTVSQNIEARPISPQV